MVIFSMHMHLNNDLLTKTPNILRDCGCQEKIPALRRPTKTVSLILILEASLILTLETLCPI
jgi:hypothetical protein